MKTITLVSLCLCLLATAINAEKAHKHQDQLSNSGGQEDHQKHAELQTADKEETELKNHSATGEQTETKPSVSGRKHRNNHHGKNKKVVNSETHTGRSRKAQIKPNKQNGQRTHNNKQNGRKHGRGKQSSAQ